MSLLPRSRRAEAKADEAALPMQHAATRAKLVQTLDRIKQHSALSALTWLTDRREREAAFAALDAHDRNAPEAVRAAPRRVAATEKASAEASVARPKKFQDFAGGRGSSVVIEHVAALLKTRDLGRLASTADDLAKACDDSFKLWSASGESMAKALVALEAKYASLRAEDRGPLVAVLAAIEGEEAAENEAPFADGWQDRRDTRRARDIAARNAYLANMRPKPSRRDLAASAASARRPRVAQPHALGAPPPTRVERDRGAPPKQRGE